MRKINRLFVIAVCCLCQLSAASQDNWAAFKQKISAKEYAGLKFKFTGAVRTDAPENSFALIFFRVDKTNKSIGFFNNMQDKPINSSDWKPYVIEGTIDADADSISSADMA